MTLEEQVAALTAQVAALTAAQAPAAPTWPQYVTTDAGVTYQVYAPLNPDYAPSMTDYIMGRAPHFIFEPSNGQKINAPLRSPNGYPLFYPLDGSGKQAGPAKVAYGGISFDNDAAVADYKSRVAAAQPDPAANQQAWDNLYADRAAPTPTAANGKHKDRQRTRTGQGRGNGPNHGGSAAPAPSQAPAPTAPSGAPVIVNQ